MPVLKQFKIVALGYRPWDALAQARPLAPMVRCDIVHSRKPRGRAGVKSVRGLNGEVCLDERVVILRRRRLFGRSTRSLRLASILAVEFRPGGATANGYLHLLTHGSVPHQGDLRAAVANHDTVMLASFQNRAFRRLAGEIGAAIAAAGGGNAELLRDRTA